MTTLRPIGPFGASPFGPLTTEQLEPLREALDEDLRRKVAGYLRSGVIIFAIMEHTRDVLESRFGVPGGSAVVTDGTHYWRFDMADYVETYGIPVDADAIELMRKRDWVAPSLSREEVVSVDRDLSNQFREWRIQ